MEEGQFFGLVKFFRNEKYLEQLLDGMFYCNTAEFYRQHDSEGVSDLHESCTHAYRSERGDAPIKLLIDGKPLEGLVNATLRVAGLDDRWLHCWTCLRAPGDEDQLESLVNDLEQIRREFGVNYAYIRPDRVRPFIEHLQTLTEHPVVGYEVEYSEDSLKWSPLCKSEKYRYQREYRFMVGKCGALHTEPLIVESNTGFRDFIEKNVSLRISNDEQNWIYFQMSGSRALVHNNPLESAP